MTKTPKYRKLLSLWQPAKHGDAISIEDFNRNLTDIQNAINGALFWEDLIFTGSEIVHNVATISDRNALVPGIGDTAWVEKDTSGKNIRYFVGYKWIPVVGVNKWVNVFPGFEHLPKGEQGSASTVPGPAGPIGKTGAVGPTGPQGPKGDTLDVSGIQPDKIIKSVGGTLTDALKGEKGDKGDTGAASTVPGPKGEKGDKGDKGENFSATNDLTLYYDDGTTEVVKVAI